MSDDYYEILGVARTATAEEIQKAYRRLARKHHPDLAEDKKKAKAQFQRIQQAYDVLSDPKKRPLYDQLGPNFESYAQAGRGPASGPAPQGGTPFEFEQVFGRGGGRGGSFEEILRQFGGFGGMPEDVEEPPPRSRSRAQAADLRETITVPFATAILGGHHQLAVARRDGSSENITLKIPPGIESGKTLRLRGQGERRRDGQRGDLLVEIQVAPHPHFRRRGGNLHVVVPVTVREAILGARVDLPTPHGSVTLTIPPGSSSGRQLRLKGLGVKRAGHDAGDLVAELQIVLPAGSADDPALRQLADQLPAENPRRSLSW